MEFRFSLSRKNLQTEMEECRDRLRHYFKGVIMKFLVTGGLGFTGSALVEFLLKKGHQIVTLDNQKGLNFDAFEKQGVKIHLGSVTDRELVRKALEGVDGVFHLAAAFRKINVSKKLYWDVNVEGTKTLCEEALKLPNLKKFVYCSTQGIHGNVKKLPGSEESPIAPEDYYQYTKWEGEKIVMEFAQKGLKAVTIRPMGIYGPGDPARFLFLYKFAIKGTFHMFGNGMAFYHPVYIDNLVDSFWLAFESDKVKAEAYLIGDEEYFHIKDLVKLVGESMGIDVKIKFWPYWPLFAAACLCELLCVPLKIPPPIFRRRVEWYQQNRAFNIDKAKKELGYKAKVGIKEGLKKTYEWYLKNGYLKKN